MTNEDIKRIESEFDIKLPDELIKYYLKNTLSGIEEFENLKGKFILNPDILIKENKKLRERGLQKKAFNTNHFCIGRVFKTDYYIIDLRDEKVKVYAIENNKTWAYNPDDLTKNHLYDKLKHFISFVEFHLKNFKEMKHREELGLPEEEMTDEEVTDSAYKLLDTFSVRAEKYNRNKE